MKTEKVEKELADCRATFDDSVARLKAQNADLVAALRDLLADHITMSRERHALARRVLPWTELPVQATARAALCPKPKPHENPHTPRNGRI